MRIAQELHDVVAHNVSLIVVQAQALGATAGDERVRRATDGIADLGRQTMAEMHRTLKLLRAPATTPRARAAAGARRPRRAARRVARRAACTSTLAVEGAPRALPQSLDLSAFRIVQEALTNVRQARRAARAARVTVAYGPEALELTIVDSGGGSRRAGRRPAVTA